MQKPRNLFQYVRKKKFDSICLQDVHIESKMETYVKHEWGYNLHIISYSGNGRGVIILINNTFEYETGRVIKDQNGNFIVVELTIADKKITLVNLYGPNEDKPQFFTELQQIVSDLGNDNIMFCGDWNLILNETLDTENYVNINNPRARNAVLNIMEENGYIDVFRILNENQTKFTWRRINPVKKQARLDFYLVSEEIFQHVHDTSIIPGYRSDQSGIYLKIKLHENERGRGYWKFNNTLLKDKDYVNVVKLQIQETINLYSRNNFNNNNNVEFTINDQLFLETLLMVIRGETIKYSSRKKKGSIREELKLEEEITKTEENININLLDTDANELNILEDKKTRLQEIRQKKLEGVILRSKCRYEDMGEKPTKYFLSLESRNFTSKVITKLTNSDGENYTNTNDILHYQKKYYENLYSERL